MSIATAGSARSDEIGRLVTELFPAQREAIKTTIRARLALPEAGPTDMGEALRILDADEARHSRGLVSASRPTRPPPSSGSFPPAPSSGSPRPMPIAGGSSYPPSSAPPRPTVPVAVEAAPPLRKRLLFPAALLVLAIGVAGGFAIVGASAAANAPRVAASAPATAASSVAPVASAVAADAPSSDSTPPVAVASAPVIEPAPTTSAVLAGVTGVARGAVRPWHAPVGAPQVKAVPHDDSAPAPAPAAEAAPAYLTLETFPWTKVSIDGKAIGATPLVHVSLPAGTHTVTMENAGEGVRESTVVTLKSGETLAKRLAFGPQ